MLPRVPRRQSTPQPPALNAVGGRVFQWRTRARAHAPGHMAAPDPPRWYVGSTAWEVRMDAGGPRPPSGPSTVGSELPLLMDTWRHRTRPRAGSRSGAVGPVR